MQELLGLPPQASAHAADVDQLIVLVHWIMAILFVGWGAFFLYTLVRFRQSRNAKADYVGVKSHNSSYLEIAVAVIEAVLLIGFAIPAWATRVGDPPADRPPTVVRVVAKQFEWHIQYPGADGMFGRTTNDLISPTNAIGLDRSDPSAVDDLYTINQLNLPVDTPVLVHLSTQDVIHSFGISSMRVKQDAIPGQEIPVWFEPTMTGDFEINCSQLCGLGHYRMRGFVKIQTQTEFQAWFQEEMAFQGAN
ncbi:MAG: cytochrome c oxidase subunit II [Acidobacteria bacterium]|nr:cytochrome c oxidase subunit II [Acidobacteriota bacterium]|tara:strand:+ start:836 stop:1582 length:747 start_codon:yes stop_codon:yes gene_type:complete